MEVFREQLKNVCREPESPVSLRESNRSLGQERELIVQV